MIKKIELVMVTFMLALIMTGCQNKGDLIEQLIKLTTPDHIIEKENGFSVYTIYRSRSGLEYSSASNYAKNSDGLYEMSGQLELGGEPWNYYMSNDEADPILYVIENHWGEKKRCQEELSSDPYQMYKVVKTSFTNSFSEYNANGAKVLIDEMRESKRYVEVEKESGSVKITNSYLFDETGDRIEEFAWKNDATGDEMKYEFSYEPTILIDRSAKVEKMDDITMDQLLKMQTPEYLLERFGAFSYSKKIYRYKYDIVENLGTFKFLKNPEGFYEMNEETQGVDGEIFNTYIDSSEEDRYYYSTKPFLNDRMEKESDTEKVFTDYFVKFSDLENSKVVSSEKVDQTYVITVLNVDNEIEWLPLSQLETFYFNASDGRLEKIVSRLAYDDQDDPEMETIYEFQYDPNMALAYAPFAPQKPADEKVNGVSLEDLIRLTTPEKILESQGSFSVYRVEDHGDYLMELERENYVKNPAGYYELNVEKRYAEGTFEYSYLDSREDESYCFIYSSEGESKEDKDKRFWDDTFTGSLFHFSENTRIRSVEEKAGMYEITVNIYQSEEMGGKLVGTHVMLIDDRKQKVFRDVMTVDDVPIICEFTYDPNIKLEYVPQ